MENPFSPEIVFSIPRLSNILLYDLMMIISCSNKRGFQIFMVAPTPVVKMIGLELPLPTFFYAISLSPTVSIKALYSNSIDTLCLLIYNSYIGAIQKLAYI
jgi:hypothetical protein